MSIGFELLWLIVCIIGFVSAVQRSRKRKAAKAEQEYEAMRRSRDAQTGISDAYPAAPWGQAQASDNTQAPGDNSPTG